MDRLPIGQMAKINQVTVETLRHYDRIDLLKPYEIDEKTGYRYYHINQSAKLDMIQFMQSLGMSLDYIKKQFYEEDANNIQKMLIEQQKFIRERITELQLMQTANARAIRNYDRYFEIKEFGIIMEEKIRKRPVFVYNCKNNIYEHDFDAYEYILRKLKGQIALEHLPMLYYCNVGTITRKKAIDFDNLFSSELFLFVDDFFEADTGIENLVEGKYICIYFKEFHDEHYYAKRLEEYIKDHNYKIVGDYVCEVVLELPVNIRSQRNMIIKIQVPVEKN